MFPRIRLSEACYRCLQAEKRPVVTRSQINIQILKIVKNQEYLGHPIYQLPKIASNDLHDRVIRQLMEKSLIRRDGDFSKIALRVLDVSDGDAADVINLVDPDAYVSHLSAMVLYDLSNRLPDVLTLTRLNPSSWHDRRRQEIEAAFPDLAAIMHPTFHLFPAYPGIGERVRGQKVSCLTTRHPGKSRRVKARFHRVATIEQTFIDMLLQPQRCGGMHHVLEVWAEHALSLLERLVQAIDGRPEPILKVRAGYILDERLGLSHPVVDRWQRFARQGGSRVLDPQEKFWPNYSEKWMLSINVTA